jgi:hypothetical protein
MIQAAHGGRNGGQAREGRVLQLQEAVLVRTFEHLPHERHLPIVDGR